MLHVQMLTCDVLACLRVYLYAYAIQALINMEQLSRDLMAEKLQKKELEKRIKEMNNKLLVGGGQKDIQLAIKEEQDKIRQAYMDLMKERDSMEKEKVQTHRYKQLLLKQRDIIVQLTNRLNERDQSVC